MSVACSWSLMPWDASPHELSNVHQWTWCHDMDMHIWEHGDLACTWHLHMIPAAHDPYTNPLMTPTHDPCCTWSLHIPPTHTHITPPPASSSKQYFDFPTNFQHQKSFGININKIFHLNQYKSINIWIYIFNIYIYISIWGRLVYAFF